MRRYPDEPKCSWSYDAILLTSSAGLAVGAQLTLTPAQQQAVYQGVASEKSQTAPAGFQVRLDERLPQSLSMRQLPASATGKVSATKGYEYAKLATNEVLLVNPKGPPGGS